MRTATATTSTTAATVTPATSPAAEVALRVAFPALCVWFGLVMGAIEGDTSWATAIAVPTFVTALLVIGVSRKVARGQRRYTRG